MVWVFVIPVAIGIPIGLTRIISGRLPLVGGGLLILVAAVFLAWGATWVSACPQCTAGSDDTRELVFWMGVLLGGIMLLLALVAVAAGAVIAGPIANWRRNRRVIVD